MVQLRLGRIFSPFGDDIFRGLQMLAKKGFRWTIFGLSDNDFCHLTKETEIVKHSSPASTHGISWPLAKLDGSVFVVNDSAVSLCRTITRIASSSTKNIDVRGSYQTPRRSLLLLGKAATTSQKITDDRHHHDLGGRFSHQSG